MIRVIAWVISVIYLILIGIPTAIGLLIIVQILSIFKFISNVRTKRKEHNCPQLHLWTDHFPEQSQDPIY